jgi:exosortase A
MRQIESNGDTGMSAVLEASARQSPWRHALPSLALLLAVILWLYRDAAATMIETWARSETFAHAFLVVPISLWLIWRKRTRLAALTPRPQPLILALLLVPGALMLAGQLVSVNAATQFAMVSMLVLAVPAVLGLEVAATILFPLLFLFFAVPLGEFLFPAMMDSTADFTVAALRLTGVPVYREGRQFLIPSGHWSVVEACSGVRYLIASLMVGTLFAYLNYRSTKRRLIFVGVAIVVPIVANWLRAYMIVMIGHLSDNRLAVGADHLFYGWVFFGIVIMIMYAIGARWSEPESPHRDLQRQPPLMTVSGQAPPRGAAATTATAAVAIAIACLPVVIMHWVQRTETQIVTPHLNLPPALAGPWKGTAVQVASWKPRFDNPSAEILRNYSDGRHVVGLYLAYYRDQGPDRKLVSSENTLVASMDNEWNLIRSGTREVSSDASTWTVNTAEVLGSVNPGSLKRPHLTVWQWYWIGGRWVAGDAAAKLYGALARLLGRGDDGAALVVFTDNEQPGAAAAALQDFCLANASLLDDLLRQTRAGR